MSLTLIANSGIQFYSFQITIDPNVRKIKPMGFYESLNDEYVMSFGRAYLIPNESIWVKKEDLVEQDYLEKNNKLKKEINANTLTSLDTETECYSIKNISKGLDKYVGEWIPIPYFKKDKKGPTSWVRMLIKELRSDNKTQKKYDITLAFDTNIAQESASYFTPKYSDIESFNGDNSFMLCDNEDFIFSFCSNKDNGEWVDKYLEKLYYPIGKIPKQFPLSKHLGTYTYLIKYLAVSGYFPEVVMYSDNSIGIEVDLVLDIGNSHTCGLLFESPRDGAYFKFDKVRKLQVRDLSLTRKDITTDSSKAYDSPLDMRLGFHKETFGDFALQTGFYRHAFQWPSLIRLGKESKRLINQGNLDTQEEKASTSSSPKRYLWDDKPTIVPWKFIFPEKNKSSQEQINFKGLINQFSEDGSYAKNAIGSAIFAKYSRRSLMTFVFIELYLHALTQINSHLFRTYNGTPKEPRRLRRIIITCPTSIVQAEQIILRQCAEDAAKAITNFYGQYYDIKRPNNIIEFQIIPHPTELAKSVDDMAPRKHWVYDEATCCQLVYIYSEISERYLKNTQLFFELYGKDRGLPIHGDQYGKESVRIGSIDIGAGTTDLMICSYQYTKEQSGAVVHPYPLFWDSFNFAGDDIVKSIIQQIIIEVTNEKNYTEGSTGVIESHAKKCGCANVTDKLLNFFDTNKTSQSAQQRVYRKNFIVQIAKPIAIKYLEHAASNQPDKVITFEDLFDTVPNEELINTFNDIMNEGLSETVFKFQDIKWTLSREKVNEIVEAKFGALLKQLAILLSAHDCDIVLLAGTPTTLSIFRKLMIRNYPVSPNRIITLNNYRVGRWYPFSDEVGYFNDPKTLVSVGALISYMGANNKLERFRLNDQYLLERLDSTCDYVGALNNDKLDIDQLYLDKEVQNFRVTIDSLPIAIGYKQIQSPQYLGRPIYSLEFATEEILSYVKKKHPDLEEQNLKGEVQRFKESLETRRPFYVTLSRDYIENKEHIIIDEIEDYEGNNISSKYLKLSLKTLAEDSHWLDQGIFRLNRKTN